MKKILLGLLLVSTTVFAEPNWVVVTDSDNGTRMFVDSESFAPSTGDGGAMFIAAQFKFFSNGEFGRTMAYVTEMNSCEKQSGILYQREFINSKWVTASKRWWDKNGNKMYDRAGTALCDILNVRLAETKKKQVGPTL